MSPVYRLVFALLILGLTTLRGEPMAAEPTLVLGEVMTLAFPELGMMHDQLPAGCEVSIPKTYDREKDVPLLVWFGGGKGSQAVEGARGLVDFDRFIVVALPYPQGKFPRLTAKDVGAVDAHWAFQRPMLERVRALLPNIDPRQRFVAGTSSGGHLIAYGLDRAWPGFADYFTHFIIHEGGAPPLTEELPGAAGKRLLVLYGKNSDSIVWRGWFNWNVHLSGADATIIGIPGAGHGLNDDGRRVIRQWIEETPRTAPRPTQPKSS